MDQQIVLSLVDCKSQKKSEQHAIIILMRVSC